MTPEFRRRMTAALAAYFGIAPEAVARPGTALRMVEPDEWDDWFELIPVGEQVGITVPPALREQMQALVAAHPTDHRLTGADFVAAWGAEDARIGHQKVYMLDPECFRPFAPPPRYTVRPLTEADRAAFEAFQARCSPDDLTESDIESSQGHPFGVFDGDRIVAGASTYPWLAFIDVGVLGDPGYRQQGLGKAVVSAVGQAVTAQGGVMCYRHALSNTGSQGIAEGLKLSLYAAVEGVAPGE